MFLADDFFSLCLNKDHVCLYDQTFTLNQMYVAKNLMSCLQLSTKTIWH